MTSINLSPSDYHKHIMSETKQELAFDPNSHLVWQKKLRKKLTSLLGDFPKTKVNLNVRSLWKKQTNIGNIEKIIFSSETHCDVIAFVCIPKDTPPPYRFVICLQGHSTGMHNSIGVDFENNDQKIAVDGDRDFANSAMQNGFAAICVEQRSFGERKEKKQLAVGKGSCQEASMHAIMLGKTLIGERVYDVDRAIDYLYTRNDVDKKKIGVMGNSGGGTVSLFASAVLSRIAYAMPSSYFCTFKDSIMSIHHCECNYIPNLLKYAEMHDIQALFAPKPLVIVAGKKDDIFPIAAVKKSFSKLKKAYENLGAGDNCHLIIGDEGHRFYAKQAWAKLNQILLKNK